MLLLLVARRGDLAVSTRKMTEEAAQVGASPEWEGQRKKDSEEMQEIDTWSWVPVKRWAWGPSAHTPTSSPVWAEEDSGTEEGCL